MSHDQQSLQDIVNAAQEIPSFTTGLGKTALVGDPRTQAVMFYGSVHIHSLGLYNSDLQHDFHIAQGDLNLQKNNPPVISSFFKLQLSLFWNYSDHKCLQKI